MNEINSKKILVLVLASNEYPAFINRFFQRNTWAKETTNVEIIFYSGGVSEDKFSNNHLKIASSKKFEDIGRKTIDCFEWISENKEFDIIFRTSASSYVDIENLIKYVNENYSNNFYSGVVAKANYLNKEITFASGSGYFLDKNLINLIIENKQLWNHKLIDDVALGEFLENYNIKPKHFNRNSVNVFPSFNSLDFNLFLTRCKINQFNLPRILEGLFMIRIKNNYIKFRKENNFVQKSDTALYFLIRFIQKIYPRKFFPFLQNRHYKKYLKNLNR